MLLSHKVGLFDKKKPNFKQFCMRPGSSRSESKIGPWAVSPLALV